MASCFGIPFMCAYLRRTPHVVSRLVQTVSVWSVKARRAFSTAIVGMRWYTAMNDNEYTPPPSLGGDARQAHADPFAVSHYETMYFACCALFLPQPREEGSGIVIQTSPTPHSTGNGNPNGRQGDGSLTSPTEQLPLGPRSAKKTDYVKLSQDSVARAARGWDDDPPVAPLGMRHYPQKNCSMATLVGGRAISDRAAISKVEHAVSFFLRLGAACRRAVRWSSASIRCERARV